MHKNEEGIVELAQLSSNSLIISHSESFSGFKAFKANGEIVF